MSSNQVNMSLDEIIKQSRQTKGGGGGARGRSRSRNRSTPRGAVTVRGGRGRGGGGRGRGGAAPVVRGRGGGVRGGPRGAVRGRLSRRDTLNTTSIKSRLQLNNRSGSQTRFNNNTNNAPQAGQRSRSRQRGQSRGRSQSQPRSLSRQGSQPRQRSRSRSRNRNNQQVINPRGRGRGGRLNLLKRGITTQSLKQNNFSRVGLRSDLILKAQKLNYVQNKVNRARKNQAKNFNNAIQSQTFTRSGRAKSPGPGATRLTVSVANDFAATRRPLNRRGRRNSTGANQIGYLDKQSLAQLTALLGGGSVRARGPGSARSANSNRSRKSNRSNRSARQRGRGGSSFGSKPVLNPRLQQEIAALQGKAYGERSRSPGPAQKGINFTPTPHLTTTSLSDRFSAAYV